MARAPCRSDPRGDAVPVLQDPSRDAEGLLTNPVEVQWWADRRGGLAVMDPH